MIIPPAHVEGHFGASQGGVLVQKVFADCFAAQLCIVNFRGIELLTTSGPPKLELLCSVLVNGHVLDRECNIPSNLIDGSVVSGGAGGGTISVYFILM